MRPLQVLVRAACVLGLTLAPSVAHAGNARVVVVRTDEARGWRAAERQLIAELSEMGVDVIELPDREGVDRDLPQYAKRYDAVAVVQFVRRGENAIVRFWAPGSEPNERGDFRHITVNLRNPNVVSFATLPVVEFVYARVEAMPDVIPTPAPLAEPEPKAAPSKREAARPELPADWAMRYGAPAVGPPVRYHVRSAMTYALRLGAGPWFSGGGTTPAVNAVLGLRAHWFELFSLETEAYLHAIPHRVEVVGGVGDLRMLGVRAHLLYEPWPRSDVGLGIGPGGGVFWVIPNFPFEEAATTRSAFVSLRAQLASALMPDFDVLFTCEVNGALGRITGYSITAPELELMRVGLDSLVALDWHF